MTIPAVSVDQVRQIRSSLIGDAHRKAAMLTSHEIDLFLVDVVRRELDPTILVLAFDCFGSLALDPHGLQRLVRHGVHDLIVEVIQRQTSTVEVVASGLRALKHLPIPATFAVADQISLAHSLPSSPVRVPASTILLRTCLEPTHHDLLIDNGIIESILSNGWDLCSSLTALASLLIDQNLPRCSFESVRQAALLVTTSLTHNDERVRRACFQCVSRFRTQHDYRWLAMRALPLIIPELAKNPPTYLPPLMEIVQGFEDLHVAASGALSLLMHLACGENGAPAMLALAEFCSVHEPHRLTVSSASSRVLPFAVRCLDDYTNNEMARSACVLMQSVSRSVCHGRRSLLQLGCLNSVIRAMHSPKRSIDTDFMAAASGLLCNLVIDFGTMPLALSSAPWITSICRLLANSENIRVRINAACCIKNILYTANPIRAEMVLNDLPLRSLCEMIKNERSSDVCLHVIGILRNLFRPHNTSLALAPMTELFIPLVVHLKLSSCPLIVLESLLLLSNVAAGTISHKLSMLRSHAVMAAVQHNLNHSWAEIRLAAALCIGNIFCKTSMFKDVIRLPGDERIGEFLVHSGLDRCVKDLQEVELFRNFDIASRCARALRGYKKTVQMLES